MKVKRLNIKILTNWKDYIALFATILFGLFLCVQPLFADTLDLQVGHDDNDAFEPGDTGTVYAGDEELKIYSDTSTTSANYRYGGIRWTNVTIPAGATITVAYISLYSTGGGSEDDINVDVHFELADSPADFTGGAYNISNRSITTASIPWVADNLTSGAWYNSGSLVNVIQEVVDDTGWDSGDPMVAVFVPNTDAAKQFRACAYDSTSPDGPTYAAKLHIEYSTSTPMYRSVGTTATALASGGGSNQLVISGSIATFGTGLANTIGVGDAIQYDSNDDSIIDAIAFIHGRSSSTQYTVKDKDGNAPTAVTSDYDWAIYRAYTSLYYWQAQDENDNLNDTVENFDTSKVLSDIVNVACYADGVDAPTSEVNITGWTTGASSYIRIFTPTSTGEVGTSQRHNGTKGTGYVLKPNTSSPGEFLSGIDIQEDYVRIEGIEIDGSTITNGQSVSGIQTVNIAASSDIRIDKCLIHDFTSTTGANYPFAVGIKIDEGSLLITNNIIYDMTNTSSDADAHAKGMRLDGEDHDVYNNTVYNVTSSGSTGTIAGIHAVSGTVTATNNYAGGTSGGANAYDFTGTMTQSYNMSSDTTADGTTRDNKAPGNQFVSTTAGSENLHLKSSADALHAGDDLSVTFTDDIDGDSRPTGVGTWDIGADEYSGSLGLYQQHYRWRNDDGAEEVSVVQIQAVDYKSNSTTSGSSSLTISNVAVSGSNRLLLVGVSIEDAGEAVSSITWNGSEALAHDNRIVDGTSARVEIWKLVAPTAGTYNVVINFDQSLSGDAIAGAVAFTGVDQATPLGSFVSDSGNATSASVAIPCSSTDDLAFAVVATEDKTPGSFSGDTEYWNASPGTSYGAGGVGAGTTPTKTLSWSFARDKMAIGGVAVKPAVTATFTAAEDTMLVGLAKNAIRRVRFGISNETAVSSGNISYELQVAEGYECSSPSLTYTAVDSFADWSVTDSSYITSGEATSNINPGLTDEATTFVAGELIDVGDSTGGIALNNDQFTEIEFSVYAESTAPDGQNYCFRLYDATNNRVLDTYTNYAHVSLAWTTAVKLLRFEAKGEGENVNVEWETAHEIGNMGFYLYRAEHPGGPYTRLTDGMIAGAMFADAGRSYQFTDTTAERGTLYYYKLEDVDDSGMRTVHGPICVDWDADGMPDDWELAHGLDPTIDDSMLDFDGDGLPNLDEYLRGTDPTNADTDGDGILDGDESGEDNPEGSYGTRSLTAGVEVIAEDETGITLELVTQSFDSRVVEAAGEEFERLSIIEYIHGYTQDTGTPELPLKGILVDVPDGKHARLRVVETDIGIHEGYQVYPVPGKVGPEEADAASVSEVFVIDETAYEDDDYYPRAEAELAASYVYRTTTKQQLVFYPLSFNPVTGQIRQFKRLRVRIDYIDGELAKASQLTPSPWQPPAKVKTFDSLPPVGVMAGVFGPAPTFVNPMLSALVSLKGFVMAAWTPPDEDLSNAAYKIMVASEGIYEINQTVLTTNSIDPALIDLSSLRIYHLGEEVAIHVYDDNLNNALDAVDYVRFYAQPVAAAYAKYAPDNVYWMTLSGGAGLPLRMAATDGTPDTGTLATTHTYTHRHELNQKYWSKTPGEDGLDRWVFSAYALGTGFTLAGGGPHPASGAPVDIDITLDDVGGALKGSVTMALIGVYETDHEVDVSINGGPVTTLNWSGRTYHQEVFDDVDINDGLNTITITCQSDTDSIAFDWFEITYDRQFSAVSDSLKFVHEDGHLYQIDGFTTGSLAVFDISDAADVRQVTGLDTSVAPAPYTLTLQPADNAAEERTYLALSEASIKTAMTIVENSVSDLADTANGADYILITHQDLGWDGGGAAEAWLTDIVNLRDTRGLRVVTVNVQDIYDEFAYGMVTPAAIKDFLAYAYNNWQAPAPQYVLLVGDAIYDFHNRLGTGKVNFVPSFLTFTKYKGETATDEWYVTVSGDDAVPDLYIGRLPAASAAEAAIMVDKIVAYETAANTKGWEKDVLLVADNQDEDWETVFETMNNKAAALLPDGMNPPFEGYLRVYQENGWDLNAELVDAISAGALVVNYAGHGSYNTWANERILDSGDMASLANIGRLPFFVSMSCLTGYFVNTAAWDSTPMVEQLMELDGKGSVAALMPTGMTTTEGQHILNNALFEEIFTKDRRQLGEAIAAAKMTLLANGDAYYEEISKTFLLFGDPAMQLKVPLPRRPAGLAASQTEDYHVALSWDAAEDADGNPVTGYNIYRKTGATGSYVVINAALIDDTGFVDENVTLGTRYYYVVRSVDGDGTESVDSESVSMVPSAPAASLAGSSSGSDSEPVVFCFISTAAGTSGIDFIKALSMIGAMALIWWLLATRRPSSPNGCAAASRERPSAI
jgi:hypothetical protein